MGIYLFQHDNFVKIGHYKGSNPWSRVAHRGFKSCVCPAPIDISRLNLVGWYPTLTVQDEKLVHRTLFKYKTVGEWYRYENLDDIVGFLSMLGHSTPVSQHDKRKAFSTRQRL